MTFLYRHSKNPEFTLGGIFYKKNIPIKVVSFTVIFSTSINPIIYCPYIF
jgi:hypothetical protein